MKVKNNLVQTWLSAIGLSPQIVETFEAAGIVHPKDLAELEVCHYPALGVKDSADRKKLFYLVQRVKLAVPDDPLGSHGRDSVDGIEGPDHGDRKGNGHGHGGVDQGENQNQYLQRAGEPTTSVDETNDLEDPYNDSFEIDTTGDDDGIDEALQEQYKPLLHDSSEEDDDDDEDSFDDATSDEFTSDEDVPSPPMSPDPRHSLADDSIDSPELLSPSPLKERETAFLKRRSARLDKVTPPRKLKTKTNGKTNTNANANANANSAIPRLQKPTRDTPERHGKKTSKHSKNSKSNPNSPTSPARTTVFAKKKRSSPKKKNNELRIKKSKSNDDASSPSTHSKSKSPIKRHNPRKTLDMEPLVVPLPVPDLMLSSVDDAPDPLDPPKARRSKRIERKLARDHMEPTFTSTDDDDEAEVDLDVEVDSPISRKSSSSRKIRQPSSTASFSSSGTGTGTGVHTGAGTDAAVDLSLTRSSSGDRENDNFHLPKSKRTAASTAKSTKERRSKLPNPTARENKRLSSIPSDRPSVIPPHRANSTNSIDEILNADDLNSVSTSTSTSYRAPRARLNSSDRSVKSTSSRMSTKSSKSYKKEKSKIEEMSSRAKSTPRGGRIQKKDKISSPESSPPNALKSRSFDNNLEKKDFGTPKGTKSNGGAAAGTGAVFVHGGGKSNKSWKSRVSILRDGHTFAHQEEVGDNYKDRDNMEEMRIRVVVRKRPMSRKEEAKKDEVDVIHPLKYVDYGRIMVYQAKTRVDLTKEVETLPFCFDNVFAEDSNNCQIYDETIKPLIPGAFEGRWASVFAYGQTGSGKTFTMMGSTLTGIKAKNRNVEHEKNYGLYVLAARDIFEMASLPENSHLSVGASLFEIYGGKLFDLLNDRAPVKCLENHKGRVCFPGLSEHPITDALQLMGLIEHGSSNRSTGSTSANRDSSRSHAVLQLHLRKTVGRKSNVEHGRLTFIDLAGSERGADTNKASRTTRLEGADINTSLLALKEVIRALATGDSMTHIPFRGSKLTQVLKESFVGKNSRTVMVACVAPSMTNCEHTINTLRYADRVKERNPETGRLPDSIAAASSIETKHRPISFPNHTDKKANVSKDRNNEVEGNGDDTDDVDENWLSDLDNDEDDDDESDIFDNYDEGIDELNEVLRSPVATRLEGNNFFGKDIDDSPQKTRKITKKEAVAPLVSTHRSIMTEMLGMVKQEMTLVNCADADRELIDDYLDELEAIQDQQLSMISTLRESLVHYYAHRSADANDRSAPSDESFDNLLSPLKDLG